MTYKEFGCFEKGMAERKALKKDTAQLGKILQDLVKSIEFNEQALSKDTLQFIQMEMIVSRQETAIMNALKAQEKAEKKAKRWKSATSILTGISLVLVALFLAK